MKLFLALCILARAVGAFQGHQGFRRATEAAIPAQFRPSLFFSPNTVVEQSKRPTVLYADASSGESSEGETEVSNEEEESVPDDTMSSESEEISTPPTNVGFIQNVKNSFRRDKEDDGLTFRQRMAKMGLSVVLSYGWVSNMSYCISLSIAWFIFSKQTGLSPLAPGQWKKFLAVYGGFYIFNNIVRPVRFAASVAVSPYFDRLVLKVQDKLNFRKKGTAIALTVLVVNVFGTTGLMCALVSLAASLAGVPVFAKP